MAQRTASTKTAANRKPKKGSPTKRKAAALEVTLDRRTGDRRSAVATAPATPQLERRQKVSRRRQIDPTTCERDYSDDEVEFMNALDLYKRKSGRMFPTCSEVLEVIRGLGYAKSTGQPSESASLSGSEISATPATEFEALASSSW